MYPEEDLLPISGLQHLNFCERQWALIHMEQEWAENVLTVEGKQLHLHVHEQGAESRGRDRPPRGKPSHEDGDGRGPARQDGRERMRDVRAEVCGGLSRHLRLPPFSSSA